MEADAVSVRVHGKGNLGAKPRSEAMAEILLSIKKLRAGSTHELTAARSVISNQHQQLEFSERLQIAQL